MEDRLMCFTPWDVQSKRQYSIDGVYPALNAGQGIGGQAHGVCYAFTWRGRENGCNVETQEELAYCLREPGGGGSNPMILIDKSDRGGVVIEGNGARPSHQGPGFLESDTMYTLNTLEHHAVAYKSPPPQTACSRTPGTDGGRNRLCAKRSEHHAEEIR